MVARSPYVQMMMEAKVNGEYRLPPVGVTVTRYQIGGVAYIKHSVRCEVEGCWFMGGSFATQAEADKYLADHKAGGKVTVRPCPTPPRRESLPSGHTLVEKLWRELDEVADCLAVAGKYREGQVDEMEGSALKGYAKGLSFSIVALDGDYFPDLVAVSRHALERLKMRKGEMDFSSTPTRHKSEVLFVDKEGLHKSADQPAATKSEPKGGAVKGEVIINNQTAQAIKAGVGSGMFSAEDMAATYGISVETVRNICR